MVKILTMVKFQPSQHKIWIIKNVIAMLIFFCFGTRVIVVGGSLLQGQQERRKEVRTWSLDIIPSFFIVGVDEI